MIPKHLRPFIILLLIILGIQDIVLGNKILGYITFAVVAFLLIGYFVIHKKHEGDSKDWE